MRRKDREVSDPEEILRIIETAKILHLGLSDGEYPYIVPLHYGYEYTGENLTFYMHSAAEGHKLDLIEMNPAVCIEIECNVELVSGGEDPCRYGAAFASVIGRGTAEVVDDEQEKIRGLKLLMKHQTGQDFEIDGKMVSSVKVIRAAVADYTAKSRKQ